MAMPSLKHSKKEIGFCAAIYWWKREQFSQQLPPPPPWCPFQLCLPTSIPPLLSLQRPNTLAAFCSCCLTFPYVPWKRSYSEISSCPKCLPEDVHAVRDVLASPGSYSYTEIMWDVRMSPHSPGDIQKSYSTNGPGDRGTYDTNGHLAWRTAPLRDTRTWGDLIVRMVQEP